MTIYCKNYIGKNRNYHFGKSERGFSSFSKIEELYHYFIFSYCQTVSFI